MGMSRFAVRRPVALTIILSIILMLGGFTFSKLGIDLLPEMNLPVAAIITSYTGVGPEEVEAQITKPLESSFSALSNVNTIQSISRPGTSIIILSFNWGTNMDTAMVDIRDRLGLIERLLPDESSKPMVIKMDPNMMPIIQIGVTADHMSLAQIQEVAQDVIEPRLSRIPDIASVTITGGLQREIKIELDPVKLQNYGLTSGQISQILAAENFNASTGSVQEGQRQYYVRTVQQFESIDDIKNVMIVTAAGHQLQLSDIADVSDGIVDDNQITKVNQQPAVGVHCSKQSDANTANACKAVKEELEVISEYLKNMGLNLHVNVIIDQSDFINQSIDHTQRMILEGAALAAVVLLLFLRNIRSTIIVITAIPISIICTFILMYFNNNSLNIITLGGLALGLGRMVDDSIVVYENIYRHRMLGLDMKEAALTGVSQVGQAVIASTMTIIAVFLPILFTEGIAGILFKPLAITVSFAILCSLFVSLTVIPFLASRLLTDKSLHLNEYQTRSERGLGKLSAKIGRGLDALGEKYRTTLGWALSHKKTVILVVTASMIGSAFLIPLVGAEFMPTMDSGAISVAISTDKGSLLETTDRIVLDIENRIKEIPEVKTIFTSVGGSGNMMLSSGVQGDRATMNVSLVPKAERIRGVDTVAEDIRGLLGSIPGTKITVTVSQQGMSMSSGGQINIQVNGDELSVLRKLTDDIVAIVRSVPGTREVSSSIEDGNPEVQIKVDRLRAASFGLTPMQVSNEIRNAMQGTVASRYSVGGEEINIRIKYLPARFETMEDLQNMNIRTAAGALIPLYQVASFQIEPGPIQIQRIDQVRYGQVSGYLLDRDLNAVITDIQALVNEMNVPPGYEVKFGGEQQDMIESFQSLALALLMAIILVYGVMAVLYESFVSPFVIMFSVPTALVGIVLALLLTGNTFSVPAFVGVIMLVGIVVANAIVFVDYLGQLIEAGMERTDAILETGRVRLRPILMTALATIFAMMPLAFSMGEGSESSAPIGIVIIGGLTISTFFTLLLVPVMYAVMDDLVKKIRPRKTAPKDNAEAIV